jgi:integrase
MARERFQQGSIRREDRKVGPVWVFRYYVDREPDGRRVERNYVLGTLQEYPSKTKAWKRVSDLDLLTKINKPNYAGPNVIFGSLTQLYVDKILCPEQRTLSHTTVASNRMWLRNHIRPRWDKETATRITHWAIEDWLHALQQERNLSNKTCGHLKQLMGQVYKFAIYRDLIPDTCNPVSKVKWSSASDYTSIVVTPQQAQAIYNQLQQPESSLVLLLTCTGLRCSEALGLKWEDIDIGARAIFVRRSWTMDREGRPKSKASKAAVACIPELAESLQAWRRESIYSGDTDWVFPSVKNRGRTPRSGSTLSTDYIKAAAIRAGVIKAGDKRPFGTHVFRHSLATSLVSWGVDIRTVQGTLRHANSQTTLNLYTQAVNKNKLDAQGMMYHAMRKPASDLVQ